MQLNHVANRVNREHFETLVEMFVSQLGFVVLRRTERSLHMRQPGTNVDLQFSRSDNPHRDDDKKRSQIAFITDTPRQDLEKLAAWLQARGLEAMVGDYSDKEFYMDAPAVFVDFVMEAMLPELADYAVKV
jgi:hypothetical protein